MSMSARLVLIAAMDEKLGVGRGGIIPWMLANDLQRFKNLTTGGSVCYGRKTWSGLPVMEIPGIREMDPHLPGRFNILLTSNGRDARMPYASSVAQALTVHEEHFAGPRGPLWVLGGARAWAEALDIAENEGVPTLMMLTRITGDFKCDTFFPMHSRMNSWTRIFESAQQTGLVPSRFQILSNS